MQNKREVNVEVLVGLFLFVALIVLGIFTIVLGGISYCNLIMMWRWSSVRLEVFRRERAYI